MRVVVVGATGNVGTSLLGVLQRDPAIDEIVGVARRVPDNLWPKTTWVAADIRTSDLNRIFSGADAVVHLAWSIQPSRDLEALYGTNVIGSLRVFRSAIEAGVPALVYASSVGTYSPGPKGHPVDESWPTDGVSTSFYSRHKAEVERILDGYEAEHPEIRIVRLRPALTFKKEAASEQRRLFAGPFFPGSLLRPGLIPFVPDLERLRFQAVHSYDVAEAYRAAILSDARGAFNITADPVLDPLVLSELFHARRLRLPEGAVRGACDLTWRMRLQPTPPGWVDMGLETPLMDGSRAQRELGWSPRFSAQEALLDVMQGMRVGAGADTPTLAPRAGGTARVGEFLSGVGKREPA